MPSKIHENIHLAAGSVPAVPRDCSPPRPKRFVQLLGCESLFAQDNNDQHLRITSHGKTGEVGKGGLLLPGSFQEGHAGNPVALHQLLLCPLKACWFCKKCDGLFIDMDHHSGCITGSTTMVIPLCLLVAGIFFHQKPQRGTGTTCRVSPPSSPRYPDRSSNIMKLDFF